MMADEINRFTIKLKAAADAKSERVRQAVIDISLELMQLLIRHSPGSDVPGTPRDTGYAAAGWYPTLGSPGSGDQRGGDIAAALSIWAPGRIGTTLWINNGVAYIKALENGHSQQAPFGMVEPAINFIREKYAGGLKV